MGVELIRLRELYNQCSPNEALTPDDERRVPFDNFGRKHVRVRGDAWQNRLARSFELSDKPVCLLFTGLRGSGKTTELESLRQRLAKPEGAHLFPVLIHAEEGIELTAPVDVPDIMFSILAGTERAVLQLLHNDESELEEGPVARLWTWLSQTDLELQKVELGSGVKLVTELRTRPSLRQAARHAIEQRLSTFLERVHGELKLMEERVKEESDYEGLIIIFDSLEKLQGTSANWREVAQSAERLFSGGAPQLRLPVHVLYTVPPSLLFRLKEPVEFLPMIKIKDREGKRIESGIAAAKDIVFKRVPLRDLVLLLGEEYGEALERIVKWSGGYPRDVVRVLQAVLTEEDLPVDRGHLDSILARMGDDYRRLVSAEDVQWLAHVRRTKQLLPSADGQIETIDRMLQNTVLLRYLNSREWYDLHPALDGFLAAPEDGARE